MFVYNMYLQIRNLSDRNARRPNVLLLVTSTLLFMMITSVSYISSDGTPGVRNQFLIHLGSQRWAIGVARIYEAVVDFEGRVPLSKYFANITLKKQITVTALFESQVIVADFILVSLSSFRLSLTFLRGGPDISLVPRVETPLVALHYTLSSMDRCLGYVVLCLRRRTEI